MTCVRIVCMCVHCRPHVQSYVIQQLAVKSVQRSGATEFLHIWEGQRQGSEQQTLEIKPPHTQPHRSSQTTVPPTQS